MQLANPSYKILWSIVLLGGLYVHPVNILAAEPYAQRPTIPADLTDSYLAKAARDSVIPSRTRVGIPGYPGAVVIRTYAVDKRPPKYEGLPIVELISADDYQTVINFYKKQIPDWRNAELLSAYYFAKHDNLNFFKPEEPHVGIHKMENYYRDGDKDVLRKLLPGAKTLIKVFFAKRIIK
jgi:hypothetical protein